MGDMGAGPLSHFGNYGTNSYGWVDCRSEFQYPGGEGDGYCWGWIGKYTFSHKGDVCITCL